MEIPSVNVMTRSVPSKIGGAEALSAGAIMSVATRDMVAPSTASSPESPSALPAMSASATWPASARAADAGLVYVTGGVMVPASACER